MLVTGASSGIGAATVRLAASRGARLVALARSEDRLRSLAEEVGKLGGDVHVYAVDCASRSETVAAAERITAELGVPDILVCNAGAGRYLFFDETSFDELEEMMGAPFWAAVHVARAFVEPMIRRGSGHIVTVNAPIAYVTWQGSAGYGMSRWALRGLHELLRADLRGTGVTISQVVAGKVASAYFEHNPGVEEAIPRISRVIGTLTPERVAETILRSCERPRPLRVIPFRLRLALASGRLFPRLTDRLVWATGRDRPAARE
jgi:uncharacterized protein